MKDLKCAICLDYKTRNPDFEPADATTFKEGTALCTWHCVSNLLT